VTDKRFLDGPPGWPADSGKERTHVRYTATFHWPTERRPVGLDAMRETIGAAIKGHDPERVLDGLTQVRATPAPLLVSETFGGIERTLEPPEQLRDTVHAQFGHFRYNDRRASWTLARYWGLISVGLEITEEALQMVFSDIETESWTFEWSIPDNIGRPVEEVTT
jgi:hypothetical protein